MASRMAPYKLQTLAKMFLTTGRVGPDPGLIFRHRDRVGVANDGMRRRQSLAILETICQKNAMRDLQGWTALPTMYDDGGFLYQ